MTGYTTALNQATGLVNNPYSNPFYQQTYTQGMGQANQMNQNMQSNLIQNMQRQGLSNSPAGAMLSQMGGYMGSHNQAGAFLNASNQAQQMYGAGMNFLSHPLQTGATASGNSKSVEQTGGLGTWLPQVIGAGLGAAGGFMGGGGLQGALKGATGGGGGGGNTSNYSNAAGGYMGNMLAQPTGPNPAYSGMNISNNPFTYGR
jgi:hypothetical protein